ncbi:MAG: hypothetical protein LBR50_08445 [Tannerella sp.]|jgi:hypothetical protein|nr:hypothetical protein [Tannerella sp.]
MNLFAKYLLNREINRRLSGSCRQREFRNLKEVKTVLIIYNSYDSEIADECQKLLEQAGKEVSTIAYQKKLQADSRCNADFIVTDSDVRFNSSVNMANVRRLLKNSRFDLAIDMTREENLLLQYILVLTDALMKVGFCKYRRQLHDMLILAPAGETDENENSMQILEKQMIYYLSTISSSREI